MTRLPLALAALSVTALAGCAHKAKPRAEETPAAPIPTPTVSAATSKQWTDLVAAQSKDLRGTYKTIAKCPVVPKKDDMVCNIGWFTYGSQVVGLSEELKAARDTESSKFIGTPPEAIAPVLDATIRVAGAMQDADIARTEACTDGKDATAACKDASSRWVQAKDDFMTQLAAWDKLA
jgi:hypothetical protein